MRQRNGALFFIAIIAALAVGGCGASPPTAEDAAPTNSSASAPLPTIAMFPSAGPPATRAATAVPTADPLVPVIEAAQQEGELTVIALPHDWMNYGEIISVFSRKYGIKVNEVDPQASSQDELKAVRGSRLNAHPLAPDVIDVGMSFAEQAKNDGLLQPYKVLAWSTIPEEARDPEGYWYGDYYGILVFEVDPAAVTSIPEDWADLLIPGNKVALPNYANKSFQSTMTIYAASLANGGSLDDALPGLRFFQQVNRAGNLVRGVVVDSNTVASGAAPIALRWDYLALANRDSHRPGQIVVVAPKTGIVAGVYAQGISAFAPHPNAARLWMEFLYSDEGQLLFVKGLGHPIRFADLLARDVIPEHLLARLLPSEIYLDAEFPSAQQLSAADSDIVAGWTSYIP